MTTRRLLVHTVFLYLALIIVVWLDFSTLGAIGTVLLLLLWRWAISLSGIRAPEKAPELQLDTISASHFVEKVRWCMDRLGVEYTERPAGGALGAFFLGRTVPRLRFRTGAVCSSIGNSPEILRYLWGRYGVSHSERAKFLEPTADRLELEQKIDRYGVDLQVWVYYHILDDRALTQHAWGCNSPTVPAWQRWTLVLLYPLLKPLMRSAFRISDGHYVKAVGHIDDLLTEIEGRLADGRRSILGGEEPDYVDIAFAAISGLWLQPEGYGGGKADAVRIDRDRAPRQMRSEIVNWTERYPHSTALIERLYKEERLRA